MFIWAATSKLQRLRLKGAAVVVSCGWKAGAEVQLFGSFVVVAVAGAEMCHHISK